MRKRIVSFILAAAIGFSGFVSFLDARAEPEAVGGENLLYEAEILIRKEIAGGSQNIVQSDPTEGSDDEWNHYSIGGPDREYLM